MTILDTHMHLVYPDRFDYPAARGGDPELRAPSTYETYRAEAAALGIDRSIHMEVDVADEFIEAESEFVTGLAPSIVGAISACRPEREDFAEHLERVARNPKILGFRRVLHVQPVEIARAPLFVANVRRLAGRYTFDLCALTHQLPALAGLVRDCGDVTFVLDHLGIPEVGTRVWEPWASAVARLASFPNVSCKVSGFIAYSHPDAWSLDHLRPYFEHVIELFGWDRVVWGSDWPICKRTADLTQWVNVTHALLAGCSDGEKVRLLHANAERIYRIAN